jgi:TrmH family RNA methyltransferase
MAAARGGAAGAWRGRPAAIAINQGRPAGKGCVWLAVESIDSPGNLGAIIRTAEATGVTGIVVIGDSADPYEPAAIRVSMGPLFSQQLVGCPVREFTAWARAFGVALVGSSPAGLLDYKTFPCRWPAALRHGVLLYELFDRRRWPQCAVR